MTAHARIATPTPGEVRNKRATIPANRLRVVGEDDGMVTKAAYEVAVIGLGYVGLPLCLAFAKVLRRRERRTIQTFIGVTASCRPISLIGRLQIRKQQA